MNETLFNDIEEMLNENALTWKWLAMQLNLHGCDVNIISLSKWVHGNQISQKAIDVHKVAVRIMKLYRKGFAEKVSKV